MTPPRNEALVKETNPSYRLQAYRLQESQGWWWLLVAPCLLGLLCFTYAPSVASFALSFTKWNLLSAIKPVGLANYQALLQTPLFWKVASNTACFVAMVSVLEVGLALATALGLYFSPKKQQTLFSTLLFLPYVTPMVAVALVFGWFYAPEGGWLNVLGQSMGLLKAPIAWLYTPQTALPSVVVVEVWKMLGYNTLLLLAGLQAIPLSVLEAASLDGASTLKQTAAIVLPLLSPTLFFVGTLTVIHALQAFDSVYLLTQGGPEHASAVIVYWVYKQAFEWFQVGPASAMAYLLFATIAVLTLVQWQARKHWVFNEDGV